MLEIKVLNGKLSDLKVRSDALRDVFELESKKVRLLEVQRELEDITIWKNPEKAQLLSQERSSLETLIQRYDHLQHVISDGIKMVALIEQEKDTDLLNELNGEINRIENLIIKMEFQRMFYGEMDMCNAYLDIQAGSGGTEAQDWAEMLLRMYLRWSDKRGFMTTLLEVSAGEVAGIKSATIQCKGDYAYGWLRTETGVHRLVRKSPFDSSNRRHTSFTSIFVSPEINDDIIVKINPADLRIDTYRASGAGGQHVNRTDSAVRITHIPTGIVVQCQNDRSQHKNKAQAMKQIKAKLYELEMIKQREKQAVLEASKSDITWGSQIRSYVLDASRVKDLRTGVQTSDTQAVLDGNIDLFIEACLKHRTV
ncbi:peptide chain release factor 2 [Coxiella endosymbiont of Amblyomma nuttalli]|uniref:peptide chain release factor 2 n=1 Tax=Coxiella endosymbiont of Amblyomma nuttalli TaxID=2749996 RepID=UPI001BAA8473|nr:peptide chain release factor 2 [Coxiella endosymbiont of Amblyomma nuttalli]